TTPLIGFLSDELADRSLPLLCRRRQPAAAGRSPGLASKLCMRADPVLCGRLIKRQVAGPQIHLEISCRQGLGVEVTLRLLTLLLQQKGSLSGSLDPLRNDFETEIVRHRNQRAHDCGIAGVVGDLTYECTVDLDPGERVAGQIAQ